MQTPLTEAIDRGDLERASVLLRGGEDPNEPNHFGESPLMVAAMSGSTAALDLLVAHGAEINRPYKDGWTVLHMAVDFAIDSKIQGGGAPGDETTESVLWLVANGSDINQTNDLGETALDVAESCRASSMIAVLRGLQAGHGRDA